MPLRTLPTFYLLNVNKRHQSLANIPKFPELIDRCWPLPGITNWLMTKLLRGEANLRYEQKNYTRPFWDRKNGSNRLRVLLFITSLLCMYFSLAPISITLHLCWKELGLKSVVEMWSLPLQRVFSTTKPSPGHVFPWSQWELKLLIDWLFQSFPRYTKGIWCPWYAIL